MSVWMIIATVGAGIGWSVWILWGYFSTFQPGRIETGNMSWTTRVVGRVGDVILRLNPLLTEKTVARDSELLLKGGLYPAYGVEELVGMQFIFAIYGYVLGYFFLVKGSLFFSLVIAVVSGWLPRTYAKRKRKERQEEIARSFPSGVDMMLLVLESGLDISVALDEIAENMQDNALRSEMIILRHNIQTGASRADALRQMADRLDPLEVRTVLMSMVQAEETGSEIAPMLRIQSESLRFNRLMRAEKAANEAPSKMVFPMVFFIFPCIMIVVFAPMVVNVMRAVRGLSP